MHVREEIPHQHNFAKQCGHACSRSSGRCMTLCRLERGRWSPHAAYPRKLRHGCAEAIGRKGAACAPANDTTGSWKYRCNIGNPLLNTASWLQSRLAATARLVTLRNGEMVLAQPTRTRSLHQAHLSRLRRGRVPRNTATTHETSA